MRCFIIKLHQVPILQEQYEGDRRCENFYTLVQTVIYQIFVAGFDNETCLKC